MKYINNKYMKFIATFAVVLLVSQSCQKDWLKPKALSFYSPENTLVDEAGFRDVLSKGD